MPTGHKRCLLLLLCLAATEPVTGATAQHAPNPAAQFRAFLEKPPWIRKIVFRLSNKYRSARLTISLAPNGEPGGKQKTITFSGYSKFEAAIQPKGYYLKILQDPAIYCVVKLNTGQYTPKPPEPGDEETYGADGHYFWDLTKKHDGLGMAPKPPYPGASAKNTILLADGMEVHGQLDKILHLGFDHLEGDRIHWVDPLHFVGTPKPQSHATGFGATVTGCVGLPFFASAKNRGPARGEIAATNSVGLPVQIRYRFSAKPSPTYLVAYDYSGSTTYLPHRIVLGEIKDGKPVWQYTNYIDSVQLGLDPQATGGYHATQFISTGQILKMALMESNGFHFHLLRNGQMVRVPTNPKYHVPEVAQSRSLLSSIVITTGGITLIVGLWFIGRRFKRERRLTDDEARRDSKMK